ncbi:MAG: rRNA maturation RNase YbeY [Bacteroidetes bacterium]|nr:rRNA maturation RNase YbeY [Bacteroidota bacterium]MBT6685363.1 rRNA maturation RNase YbeY [Bacteroidota bacterium]MBT7145057.1 rRNA maturation RNase YbeY [Bacteroidota bacterium]MBT7492742.1 rRNA maturation RNase YbeY [Bacteroidota bacterium]
MSVNFFNEETNFDFTDFEFLKDWISKVVINENSIIAEINYIFCSDKYLLELNKKHLNHNYFTDVITFNYSEGSEISADIFISLDRVKENAEKYSVSFQNELSRVALHGVLHLLKYDDKTDEEKEIMTQKEDFYLEILP